MKFYKDTIEKIKRVSHIARIIGELCVPSRLGWSKNSFDFQTAKFTTEQVELNLISYLELLGKFMIGSISVLPAGLASGFAGIASGIKGIEIAFSFIPLFQSSLAPNSHIVEKLENTYIKLPPTSFQKSLNKYSNFSNKINEFNSYKASKDNYLLRTTTTETTDLGIVKLRTIQETQMQIQSLQSDVKELNQYMVEDGKKKDEMLGELLDYFRNGGTSTVKIKKIKYNKKTAELIIDDKIISIKADTNQHYLCKVLLSSKASIKRVWEIYDIVETLGEDTYELHKWKDVIYNTVRHLNEKIKQQAGIDKFILYDNKTVIVNPKYLD